MRLISTIRKEAEAGMGMSEAPTGVASTLAAMVARLPGTRQNLPRPDGTQLHVVDSVSGDGVVLLVHGFGVSSSSWSLVHNMLVAQGFRVLAYDHRGHGLSTMGRDGIGSAQLVADLRAVVTSFDLRDATLVCHSMGNFVGIGALGNDEVRARFARAVLVNPVTGNSLKGAPAVRLQGPLVRMGVIQRLARWRLLGGVLARASLGPRPDPAVLEATRMSLAAVPKSVGPCTTMLQKESVAAMVPFLDLPLRVLTSTTDRTTPSWHAELIVARASNARIDYVADAGHMLPFEAPAAVVAAVVGEEHQ